jgi:phage tail-like protein
MKINPEFKHDIFRFIHKPIRLKDAENFNFLERFLLGPQAIWEEKLHSPIKRVMQLIDPEKTPQPRFLKDIVGFTKELDNITNDISDADLRKVISLAVALWKTKGTEPGYENIVRLFTGSNVRIFNWFAFRYIVGEKAFGEEQLGEDAWIISKVGITATNDPSNIVVGLWTFEGNLKDRSLYRNDGAISGFYNFHSTGPVVGSKKYLRLNEGLVEIQDSVKYDFSGSFTIEGFIRTTHAVDGFIFSKKFGTKEVSIEYKTSTNQLIARASDGAVMSTVTIDSAFDFDSGDWRHWALVVNRTTDTMRLWFNGTEASMELDISTLGDLTNDGSIFIGAENYELNNLPADYDNIRICLNPVYLVTGATIVPPATTFIEYREEQLDEFKSDIRIVDDGSLNRLLIKRILFLMRPVSERLTLIYVRYSDDFLAGKGNYLTVQGAATVNMDNVLVLPSDSLEVIDIENADDFQNIFMQAKLRVSGTNMTGMIVFNYQDSQNYYAYKVRTTALRAQLVKVVAGVETQLAPEVIIDIAENADYVLTISTFYDLDLGSQVIKCLFDGGQKFKVFDSTFTQGRFGFKTIVGSQIEVTEVEMFEQPLEIEEIGPGFE